MKIRIHSNIINKENSLEYLNKESEENLFQRINKLKLILDNF